MTTITDPRPCRLLADLSPAELVARVDLRYLAPRQPGYSAAIRPESLDEFEYPGGAAWRS